MTHRVIKHVNMLIAGDDFFGLKRKERNGK